MRFLSALLVILLVPSSALAQKDLNRARALDQQGARAYTDGRYNDAIHYFEESLRLGGPPFELWNIAKCYAKLDEPGNAAEMLERYLATPSLPNEDRREASDQLETLRRRPSTVTLSSTPNGATVLLDGQPVAGAGPTPTTFAVPPGAHTLTLNGQGFATTTKTIDARYGRAIILDVPLERAAPPPPPPGPPAPPVDYGGRPFAMQAHIGAMFPRYGGIGGSPQPEGVLSGTVRVAALGGASIAAGALFSVTEDAWDNAVAAPASVPACGTLRNPRQDTAFAAFLLGSAGWEVRPRFHVEALLGVGLAAISADDLGGDLFVPACRPSPAPQPALLLGARLEYALTPAVRLSALPLTLQLQPSFRGAREQPIDASGVWMRFTVAVGVGIDL